MFATPVAPTPSTAPASNDQKARRLNTLLAADEDAMRALGLIKQVRSKHDTNGLPALSQGMRGLSQAKTRERCRLILERAAARKARRE